MTKELGRKVKMIRFITEDCNKGINYNLIKKTNLNTPKNNMDINNIKQVPIAIPTPGLRTDNNNEDSKKPKNSNIQTTSNSSSSSKYTYYKKTNEKNTSYQPSIWESIISALMVLGICYLCCSFCCGPKTVPQGETNTNSGENQNYVENMGSDGYVYHCN